MIKYIKKLIKKQRLLNKYKNDINDEFRFLNSINPGRYRDYCEKELLYKCRCYNRLKKL